MSQKLLINLSIMILLTQTIAYGMKRKNPGEDDNNKKGYVFGNDHWALRIALQKQYGQLAHQSNENNNCLFDDNKTNTLPSTIWGPNVKK